MGGGGWACQKGGKVGGIWIPSESLPGGQSGDRNLPTESVAALTQVESPVRFPCVTGLKGIGWGGRVPHLTCPFILYLL